MKKDLAQLAALAIFAAAVYYIQYIIRHRDEPPAVLPELADLQSADVDVARAAYAALMEANGVADAPDLNSGRETAPLAFTAPGDVALLLPTRLFVFDRNGALLHSAPYARAHAVRAADLNGDGLDELLLHTCGGGGSLFVRNEVVVTGEGGRPREILSLMEDVADGPRKYHADITYAPPDPDGSVVAVAVERLALASPIDLTTRYVWRPDAAKFVPIP